jgi:RNA polymerase sigma-B factor
VTTCLSPEAIEHRRGTDLVERYLPLARSLALRYRHSGEPLDDLVQVASLGLVKAIDRFDESRGLAFSTFAVPTILGELRRHFRDRTWAIRVPRRLQEAVLRMERVSEDMSAKLGRAPTAEELADEMELHVEDVLEAMQAADAYRLASLDAPRESEDDGGGGLFATIGAEDPGYGHAESRAAVQSLLSVLTRRQREVLRLRFEEDLTQSAIGERLGISQMHVSRVIRRAIDELRAAAEERDLL